MSHVCSKSSHSFININIQMRTYLSVSYESYLQDFLSIILL